VPEKYPETCHLLIDMLRCVCLFQYRKSLMTHDDDILIRALSNLSQDWEFALPFIEAVRLEKISDSDKERLASILVDASKTSEIEKKEIEIAIAIEIAESTRKLERSETEELKVELLEKLEAL